MENNNSIIFDKIQLVGLAPDTKPIPIDFKIEYIPIPCLNGDSAILYLN